MLETIRLAFLYMTITLGIIAVTTVLSCVTVAVFKNGAIAAVVSAAVLVVATVAVLKQIMSEEGNRNDG